MSTKFYIDLGEENRGSVLGLLSSLGEMTEGIEISGAAVVQVEKTEIAEALERMLSATGQAFHVTGLESPAAAQTNLDLTFPDLLPVSNEGETASQAPDNGLPKCRFCEMPVRNKQSKICGSLVCRKKRDAEHARTSAMRKKQRASSTPVSSSAGEDAQDTDEGNGAVKLSDSEQALGFEPIPDDPSLVWQLAATGEYFTEEQLQGLLQARELAPGTLLKRTLGAWYSVSGCFEPREIHLTAEIASSFLKGRFQNGWSKQAIA